MGKLEKRLHDLATQIKRLGDALGAHPAFRDLTRKATQNQCETIPRFTELFLESEFITLPGFENRVKEECWKNLIQSSLWTDQNGQQVALEGCEVR